MIPSWRKRIVAVTPIICLITYLSIGFLWHIWGPTLLIFTATFIVPWLLYGNMLEIIYPAVCITLYLVCGFVFHMWHPTWIIFLTIPVFYILFGPYLKHTIVITER